MAAAGCGTYHTRDRSLIANLYSPPYREQLLTPTLTFHYSQPLLAINLLPAFNCIYASRPKKSNNHSIDTMPPQMRASARAATRTNPINSTNRIQTTRATDHATWELPSAGRQLTAKDLIQEWHDTAHQNWSSELGADQYIKKLTQRFLKEDPVHSYSQDVFRRYYSIYRVTTKKEVHHHGAEETRPCLRTWSKVHKLDCGHTVFTEKETCCAGNCDSIYGNCGGPQYFCQLCARDDLRVPDSALPDRWYDLLLTRCGKPGQAAGKSAQPDMLEAQPAYLDQHGYVLLPRIHCTIAMVRASEIRKEEEIKTLIATICPIDNGRKALEYFEHLLVHHRAVKLIEMRLLAFLAIRLSQYDMYNPTDRKELLASLGVEDHPEIETLFQIALDNSVQWGATVSLIKIMSKLKEKSQTAMSELRLRKEAMQVCSDVVACGALRGEEPLARPNPYHDPLRQGYAG
jgi:hypothetical protein